MKSTLENKSIPIRNSSFCFPHQKSEFNGGFSEDRRERDPNMQMSGNIQKSNSELRCQLLPVVTF